MNRTAPTAPVIAVVNGIPTTTSTYVADYFGKRHDVVMRAIRELIDLDAGCLCNFVEASRQVHQPHGGMAEYPEYRITEEGFMLLAMGFTGKKALGYKLAFVAEFKRLRAAVQALSAPAATPVLVRPSIRRREDLSFTRLDAESRLTNWVVEPRERMWGDGIVRGEAFFQEVAELASHDEHEAYNAVRFAFIGSWPSLPGNTTRWNSAGPGEEFGFADAVARAVIDGLHACRGGAEPFDPDSKAQARRRREAGRKRGTVVKRG